MENEQLRGAVKETAQEVRSPDHFAKRAHQLRRRRKVRGLLATGVVAAVIAVGVAVSLAVDGDSNSHERSAGRLPAPDVVARPDQSPPRGLIAAGSVAVSGYYTAKVVKKPNGDGIVTYEWSLLNAATERYDKTAWAWLDVAPGMKTAAVLERDLPASRIGLLNLTTDKVQRWIKTGKDVGGVQFSPDGKRLVATTYSLNPDGLFKDASYRLNDKTVPGPKPSRTGFYVIDVASGRAVFTELPPRKNDHGFITGGRQDLRWGRDGKLLWEPWSNKAGKVFYTVGGKEVPVPEQEANLGSPGAVLSPDGKLVTGGFAGQSGQIVSEVLDARTGKRAALVPGQELLAWADNHWLIAWRCNPKQCDPGKGEFRNQLVLASLDGKTVTPLSGFRNADLHYSGRWTPILTDR
ncbi:hypothetical protein BX281_4570 [Streptomyces sp. Ag82_O1-15]|uniref:hypothetical protein n=1 Tax=Streptomyces sp. Ag82_O1-15 TaxID=1938855 RepID=UPI000BD04020|nr:hypothetical protein [Streptomyces sp. Ag82_O1-15]PBC96570.1 hypothetical protein BX281_4570 [Streptomyces sp. Ag82_O1-15]